MENSLLWNFVLNNNGIVVVNPSEIISDFFVLYRIQLLWYTCIQFKSIYVATVAWICTCIQRRQYTKLFLVFIYLFSVFSILLCWSFILQKKGGNVIVLLLQFPENCSIFSPEVCSFLRVFALWCSIYDKSATISRSAKRKQCFGGWC